MIWEEYFYILALLINMVNLMSKATVAETYLYRIQYRCEGVVPRISGQVRTI